MCGCVATGRGFFLGLWKFSACNTEFFLIYYIKLKYYGNFIHITQSVHSIAHLNPLKGIFSDKLLIIVEILSFQFGEIFNFQETWPWKVLNFSHVFFIYLLVGSKTSFLTCWELTLKLLRERGGPVTLLFVFVFFKLDQNKVSYKKVAFQLA